ncbi:MAG TPA: hypothetical protein VHA10_17125 [Hypericibacter adhaerens]|uniref:Uncharacterized protein n=1 Tax=Hypericibacter adhaerens TaxID=2602016 RepID=A0A5J6N0M7_9PROT|nr:hypothetical protein [Hypericibacter adhaerens]QEX22794.1 hypothetical protein FRZ61_27260 [Hypericibacter adhaerens]HWA44944.1 hypothetical protein [Hypericibacter adhaerens]
MATVRIFDHGTDLSRREEAARGFAPVRVAQNQGQQIWRMLLIFATTTGVSLLALIGLLFYGAILGF